MTHHPILRLTGLALAAAATLTFTACSTVPAPNARLEQARSDYAAAQADPRARELAPLELKQAGEALGQADASWTRRDDTKEVDHLAYLAGQRVAIAQETASQRAAEQAVSQADTTRDKLRLAARTQEADSAQRGAETAKRQAEASQRQSDAATLQAQAAQRQSESSQVQAADAEARSRQLEAQLRELNAKQTDRGLVITIGDVLFDTDRSQLKPGATRNVDKLVAFLKANPQRKALIEGYTDSTGGEDHNQSLSGRRADAVRAAMVEQGVGPDRISTHGYGEAFPVAGNDSAGGRQLNRRVEIVLSDESGAIQRR